MKKILLLSVLITTTILSTQAGLKRVGFSGAPIAGVDFADLTSAQNNPGTLAGDTIQVYPGALPNAFTQTKKLIIIGIGYLTAGTNANTNLNVLTTSNAINIGTIQYSSTSNGISGSEYHGISFTLRLAGNIGTTINNITIQRCSLNGIDEISATGSINNLKIMQCIAVGSGFVPNVALTNCLIGNSFKLVFAFVPAVK